MKLIPNKIYKVYWEDIESATEWKDKKEILKEKLPLIQAVYFYIGKSKDETIQFFASEYHKGEYGNRTNIPTQNIKQTKLLK